MFYICFLPRSFILCAQKLFAKNFSLRSVLRFADDNSSSPCNGGMQYVFHNPLPPDDLRNVDDENDAEVGSLMFDSVHG